MAGSWSLHFISISQGSVGWDPLGWPANRLSSLSCGICESLDTASPAAGDSSGHNSYCRAHYLPPWTQREVSQLLYSFSFVCCSWECCLWRLRLDPSALHSLILPEQLRLHLTPFTPMISSFYPNHPEKRGVFLQWRAGLSDTPIAEEFDDNYLVIWAHWQHCGEDRWTVGHAMHNSLQPPLP